MPILLVLCAKISSDLGFDCDNPQVGGNSDELILINKDDIDSYSLNITNPQIIEDILLASGTTGYSYTGKNNSIEPESALVKQAYSEVYAHTIKFIVFLTTPEAKEQLELLAQGKVVAIIENNFQGATGNAAFELYGKSAGLVITEMKRVVVDQNTQGAYQVTLSTPEKAKESNLPATIFDTSYDTTRTLINALL